MLETKEYQKTRFHGSESLGKSIIERENNDDVHYFQDLEIKQGNPKFHNDDDYFGNKNFFHSNSRNTSSSLVANSESTTLSIQKYPVIPDIRILKEEFETTKTSFFQHKDGNSKSDVIRRLEDQKNNETTISDTYNNKKIQFKVQFQKENTQKNIISEKRILISNKNSSSNPNSNTNPLKHTSNSKKKSIINNKPSKHLESSCERSNSNIQKTINNLIIKMQIKNLTFLINALFMLNHNNISKEMMIVNKEIVDTLRRFGVERKLKNSTTQLRNINSYEYPPFQSNINTVNTGQEHFIGGIEEREFKLRNNKQCFAETNNIAELSQLSLLKENPKSRSIKSLFSLFLKCINCEYNVVLYGIFLLHMSNLKHCFVIIDNNNIIRLLVISFIISMKVLYDYGISNEIFSALTGISKIEICMLEFFFLNNIDFETHIKPDIFSFYLGIMDKYFQ